MKDEFNRVENSTQLGKTTEKKQNKKTIVFNFVTSTKITSQIWRLKHELNMIYASQFASVPGKHSRDVSCYLDFIVSFMLVYFW